MTVCLEGKCSIQLSYERIRLFAVSLLGPVVGPVDGSPDETNNSVSRVCSVFAVAVTVGAATPVVLIELSSVSLCSTRLTVLSVLLLVVSSCHQV